MGDDALGALALRASDHRRENYSKFDVLDCPEICFGLSSDTDGSDNELDIVLRGVRTAETAYKI